jgi:hypothetical protein
MRAVGFLLGLIWIVAAQPAAAGDDVVTVHSPWDRLDADPFPDRHVSWRRDGATFTVYATPSDGEHVRAEAVRDGETIVSSESAEVCDRSAVRVTSSRGEAGAGAVHIIRLIATFGDVTYLATYAYEDSVGSDAAIVQAMQRICDPDLFLRGAPPAGWFAVRQTALWPGGGGTNYLRLSVVDPVPRASFADIAFDDLTSAETVRDRTTAPITLCDGTTGQFFRAVVRPAEGGDVVLEGVAVAGRQHGYLLEYLRPKDRLEDPAARAALRGFCVR